MPDSRESDAIGQNGSDPWNRLRESLRLRPSRHQFVAGLLCLVLGFALAVQVRSTQDSALTNARTTDLVRILDDLTEQRERLVAESARLTVTLDELRAGAGKASAARDAARERLRTLGILTGTVPAHGPGILLTITDPDAQVAAADLLDAVEELRDAGAEAIQIADVRIVGSSWFIDATDGVQIDGVVVGQPYSIRAIGDPTTMSAALAIPGGVLEGLSESGTQAFIGEQDEIEVDAVKSLPVAEYAHPA